MVKVLSNEFKIVKYKSTFKFKSIRWLNEY